MTTRVTVAGGGYAGVMAANRLHRSDDVEVTLVNPRATFVDRIRLHQHATGGHDATVDYAGILHERVRFVADTVTSIDAPARSVALASGRNLGYDYLVYAVGSGAAVPSVPGAAEHALRLATLEDAVRLRAALEGGPATTAVVVVGGGATGIETASELAESGREVVLACGGELGPYLHEVGRRVVRSRLERLGVTVVDGPGSAVASVDSDAVDLADGRRVPSAVTVWTAGFGVPDLARRSGLSTDPVGRLLVDETLTSVDDLRIVAAGDAADPSGHPLRMSCQAAIPLGAQAAGTILSRMAGSEPRPIDNAFVGMCLSLGRRAGTFQVAHLDDTARGLAVSGRPAAWLKEAVCRSVVAGLRAEARRPGLMRWPTDGRRSARVIGTDLPDPVEATGTR
jgi:NADH dehydrogenase FAD-containing subunit